MPPSPPPPPSFGHSTTNYTISPPTVPSAGPPGSRLLHLLTYNSAPFHDHWAFFLQFTSNPSLGVLIHAKGDVRVGFEFQIERAHDTDYTDTPPSKKIPLQWIDGTHIADEPVMLNHGVNMVDDTPVCRFETVVKQVEMPVKSLVPTTEAVCVQSTRLHVDIRLMKY